MTIFPHDYVKVAFFQQKYQPQESFLVAEKRGPNMLSYKTGPIWEELDKLGLQHEWSFELRWEKFCRAETENLISSVN